MANKYYAVKVGKKVGIFTTWDECNRNVTGFSGAQYKSFKNIEDARKYLHEDGQADNRSEKANSECATAYVDGSFDSEKKEYTYGAVIFWKDKEYHFSNRFNDENLAKMHNVAGELKGSEIAMEFALENNIKELNIYHDYEGIEKWCTGEWKAKKVGTQAYKNFYDSIKNHVTIKFVKVKAHSGNKYNELADKLAKEAFNKPICFENKIIDPSRVEQIDEKTEESGKQIKTINSPVYIDRDKIADMIFSIGSKEWIEFKCEKSTPLENGERYIFYVDDKKATLDFLFRQKGLTTIKPTSANIELSRYLKILIEKEYAYTHDGISKTHSLTISKEWCMKLVDYLKGLDNVSCNIKTYDNPKHYRYTFQSSIGDKITLNIYDTGKLLIQGKPAYLYSEAISFLSYCPEITVKDILDVNNKLQDINIKVDDIRKEIKNLMPNAYENIDEVIIKMLSPSFSFKKLNMNLEDYSCYAFPALRALEGYLKYLFYLEGIDVGHSFGKLYDYNNNDGQYYLKRSYSTIITNNKVRVSMQYIYNYFNKNRHTLFHTEQILISSRILEDKQEADLIINEVIQMIESTYTNINK